MVFRVGGDDGAEVHDERLSLPVDDEHVAFILLCGRVRDFRYKEELEFLGKKGISLNLGDDRKQQGYDD